MIRASKNSSPRPRRSNSWGARASRRRCLRGGSPKHSSFRIPHQDRLLREAEQSLASLAEVHSVIRDIRLIRSSESRSGFKKIPTFPRNLRPNFRLYISNHNKTCHRRISLKKNEKQEKEIKSHHLVKRVRARHPLRRESNHFFR